MYSCEQGQPGQKLLVPVRTSWPKFCPVIAQMPAGVEGRHEDLCNGQADPYSDLQEVQGTPAEAMKRWEGKRQ